MKKLFPVWLTDLFISIAAAIGLSAAVAAFYRGDYFKSWLAAGVISLIVIFVLLQIWRKLGASRTLMILMLVTFGLRIAVGIFLYRALPSLGYADNLVTKAGFVYSDAYDRDLAAFTLAQSDSSLFTAFTHPDTSDQYGGLLFLSASIYRALSPDISRPLLISLLAVFAMTAGVAFLWAAIQKRWSVRIASIAAWTFALYPDSVLLGSSQMREPFLIALGCVTLWAVMEWKEKPARAAIISLIALSAACLFSVPAGGIYAVILIAFVLLEWTLQQTQKRSRALGIVLMGLLALGAVIAGGLWLKQTLYYDAYVTRISSGWITKLISQYGEKWTIPFTTVYGLTQPLLPAAIFEPSLPIWTTIGVLRSLGWWCVVPFLIFGLFSVWKAPKQDSKAVLILFSLIFAAWIVVSSARAGGDLWDNPRYRYMLLPLLCLLVAWTCEHFRATRSPWFWRWVAVIAEFLLFFTDFYITRYVIGSIPQLPFSLMILMIICIAVLILGGGWIWDLLKRRRKLARNR